MMGRLTGVFGRTLLTMALGAMGSAVVTTGGYGQGVGQPLDFDPQEASTRVGTRAAQFLQVGVGARSQALGGAASAAALGVTALYWNTAAIAEADGFSAGYSAADLYDGSGITHDFLGVLLPTRFGTIGASVIQLGSGQMTRTTEAFPFGGDPAVGATFEWVSLAVGLHYANRITDRLAVGAAAKIVNEGISGATADFVAVDLGTVFHTGVYGTVIGASLSNIGTSSRMQGGAVRDRFSPARSEEAFESRRIMDLEAVTGRLDLPTSFGIGTATSILGDPPALLGSHQHHSVTVMGQLWNAINTDLQTSLAVEYGFQDLVFLRFGKQWLNEARADHRQGMGFGLSAGAGLKAPLGQGRLFMLDYAYIRQADLNHTQIISFELSL